MPAYMISLLNFCFHENEKGEAHNVHPAQKLLK